LITPDHPDPPVTSDDNYNTHADKRLALGYDNRRTLIVDLIGNIRKDVKGETRNISIIANTALSAFTDNPINLAIVSPSSEGKTYLVVQTLRRFPPEYIWMYRKVSPKTFTRERGILAVRVIKDNEEIFETTIFNKFTQKTVSVGAYLKFLKDAISDKRNEDNIDKQEAYEALSDLEDNLYTLIDFKNRVLVFLDRPDPALWNELLSVLSHDKEYIVTSFVEGEGIKRNRKVVFQGCMRTETFQFQFSCSRGITQHL
jgi:hypothetical protein